MPEIDRHQASAEAGTRGAPRVPATRAARIDAGLRLHWPVLVLLALYWIGFQAIFFLLAALDRPEAMPASPGEWLAGMWRYMTQPVELAICGVGALVCYLIHAALGRFAASSLKVKIAAALAATLIAACTFALANTYELALGMIERPQRPYPVELTRQIFTWLAPFGFWTGIAMAVTHNRLLQIQQQRLATLRLEAQQAKLHALSYQLSPHFLFNTLNSISWMVWEKEWQGAERMIVNFSDFLRTTLMLDPSADVPLRDEIELQRKYLSVEQVRFSDRLQVRFDIPEALEHVPVPALILQPLVENAIRHAVATSAQPVRVTITATRADGVLMLTVEDDGSAGPAPAGSGLGLANVTERLRTRYGDAGGLSTHVPAQGFRATIRLPLP